MVRGARLETMSRRREPANNTKEVEKLRADLNDLKAQQRASESVALSSPAGSELDKLSAVEQSVACLGVSPDSWKPIAFLNNAHYEQLISANMLDDDLARRIEAYKHVAQGAGVAGKA